MMFDDFLIFFDFSYIEILMKSEEKPGNIIKSDANHYIFNKKQISPKKTLKENM